MPETDIYSIPYQGLNDEPDGAALGQGIAEAVEDELERIDAAIVSSTGVEHVEDTATVDVSSTSQVGSGTGVVFTAPLSGQVEIAWYDRLEFEVTSSGINRQLRSGIDVRTGGTIGSGTVVHGPTANQSIHLGTNTVTNTAGWRALVSGADVQIVDGLTPGATYNVQIMHVLNANTGLGVARSTVRRMVVRPA